MKQFLFVFFLSPFIFSDSTDIESTYLDFNELLVHADIVLVGTVIDQCDRQQKESFVQFDIQSQLKGAVQGDLFINSEMLYQGDISQSAKTLDRFLLNEDYLLFLQKGAPSLVLLNQYTLQQVETDTEELLIPIVNQSNESSKTVYAKSKLLQAIEAFVYNETEILPSEILSDVAVLK